MASFDEIKEQAENVAGMAKDKALEFAEAAGEWAEKERPEMDKALETAGDVAKSAVDAVADGANAVYEAIKNKAEEASGLDVDGDGVIGGTGAAPGEVKGAAQVAAETVAGAAGAAAGMAKGFIDKLTGKEDEIEAEAEVVEEAAEAAADEAEVAEEAAEAAAEEAAEPVTGWRSATAGGEE